MRRIKNRNKLKKEGLITSILKLEISNAEHGYMKNFNTNVDTNVDTYDVEIRDKISDIRVILGRFGGYSN